MSLYSKCNIILYARDSYMLWPGGHIWNFGSVLSIIIEWLAMLIIDKHAKYPFSSCNISLYFLPRIQKLTVCPFLGGDGSHPTKNMLYSLPFPKLSCLVPVRAAWNLKAFLGGAEDDVRGSWFAFNGIDFLLKERQNRNLGGMNTLVLRESQWML